MLQRGCADIATPPLPEIRPKWHAFLMAYGWLRGREVVRSVAEAASERVIKRVGLDIELNVEIALDLVEHRFGEAKRVLLSFVRWDWAIGEGDSQSGPQHACGPAESEVLEAGGAALNLVVVDVVKCAQQTAIHDLAVDEESVLERSITAPCRRRGCGRSIPYARRFAFRHAARLLEATSGKPMPTTVAAAAALMQLNTRAVAQAWLPRFSYRLTGAA